MIKQDCWKKKKQQGRIQEVRLREMEAQQAQMLMQIHPVIRARQAHRQVPDTYSNNSAIREWLYNSTKEQRQIDPGVLGKYNSRRYY